MAHLVALCGGEFSAGRRLDHDSQKQPLWRNLASEGMFHPRFPSLRTALVVLKRLFPFYLYEAIYDAGPVLYVHVGYIF